MFQGHSICVLDAKSRLTLPAKFRKNIRPDADNKVVLTRGLDKCLYIYPNDEWEKVKTNLETLNTVDKDIRFFVREFLMYVNDCELDSHNRILVPQQLISLAGIKKEVVVAGMLNKLEIWDPVIKAEYAGSKSESFEAVAQKFSDIFMKI